MPEPETNSVFFSAGTPAQLAHLRPTALPIAVASESSTPSSVCGVLFVTTRRSTESGVGTLRSGE